jgi:hypothetical protein
VELPVKIQQIKAIRATTLRKEQKLTRVKITMFLNKDRINQSDIPIPQDFAI